MAQAEAERLFNLLIAYARGMNDAGRYDISLILSGYDKDVLSKYTAVSTIAKRWSSIIKEYRRTERRKQSKLIGFYSEQ